MPNPVYQVLDGIKTVKGSVCGYITNNIKNGQWLGAVCLIMGADIQQQDLAFVQHQHQNDPVAVG